MVACVFVFWAAEADRVGLGRDPVVTLPPRVSEVGAGTVFHSHRGFSPVTKDMAHA